MSRIANYHHPMAEDSSCGCLTIQQCITGLMSICEHYTIKKKMVYLESTEKEEEKEYFQNAFTDFTSPLHPNYIEMAAHLIAAQIEKDFAEQTENDRQRLFVCSMGVRGAGALCHSVSNLLQAKYSLSDWYPPGSVGELEVGECVGVGGVGQLYLNGIPDGAAVVMVADRVYGGSSVRQMIEAIQSSGKSCRIVGVYSALEMHLSDGNSWARAVLEQRKIPLRSFVRVRCDAANYKVEESTQHSLRSAAERGKVTTVAPYPYDTIRVANDKSAWATQLSQLTPAEVEERERTIETVFVGIPIIHNKEVDYPYCYFSFTDFIPALEPSIVEAMADLCVYYFYQGTPEPCNVLVSEGDRGGASLLHAVALRLQLPYVVAHWLTSATQASPVSTGDRRASVRSHVTSIGFSGGESQLALNGIKEGDCCLFVDDMLSSGGTAEAIFDCVTERGGEVKAALFGSEKLYPVGDTDELERKGFKRIGLIYPECRLITLTQFIVRGTVTQAPSQRVESHEGI